MIPRIIAFAIIALLVAAGLWASEASRSEPPLLIDPAPAASKVQQPMCVAPWLWSHTCDRRGCRARNPRSIA